MKILLFLILIFNVGKKSAYGQEIEIDTTPKEAELFLKNNMDGKEVKLGKTPYKEELESVFGAVSGSNMVFLVIRKDGFQTREVLLTKSKDIDIKIKAELKVSDEIKTIKEHDKLMIDLFKVQKLIRGKNFSGAIGQLEELEKDHQFFSIIPELKAIALYMNKDVEKALSMFRHAFSLNPQNVDAYHMKVYLEKQLGVNADNR